MVTVKIKNTIHERPPLDPLLCRREKFLTHPPDPSLLKEVRGFRKNLLLLKPPLSPFNKGEDV
jgi:hypothetical protein